MKRLRYMVSIMILVLAVALSGCSAGKSSKTLLQDALKNTMEASSYRLSMSMQVEELELPQAGSVGFTPISMAGIMKDAIINIDAVYDKEAGRTDMNLELVLPGMMEMKLELPVITTQDSLYIKLPAIPLLPIIPQNVSDHYIKMDLDELAKQQGEGAKIDVEAQQLLGQEISAVALKHFDEKNYFSELKLEEAELPEGLKADRIVKFAVTEENYPQTVETLVNKVLPEIIDLLLANASLLETVQVDQEQLEQYKNELQNNKTELLNVLQNEVKLNALEFTGATQGKYLVYQQGRLAIDASNSEIGHSMKFAMSFTGQYSDIGKDVEFDGELPAETLTFEEAMSSIRLPFGILSNQ